MTLDVLDVLEQHQVGRLLVLSSAPVRGFQYAATVRQVFASGIRRTKWSSAEPRSETSG